MVKKISPPISRPQGGKYTLAKTIIKYFPENFENFKVYCEPFCGAAWVYAEAYAEAKPSGRQNNPAKVVLNDIDSELITFFEVIREDIEKFSQIAKGLSVDKETFEAVKKLIKSGENKKAETAAYFYYLNRNSYAGRGNACNLGERKLDFDRCKNFGNMLKGVELLNLDYIEVIKDFDSKETFFYFDPPYMSASYGWDIDEVFKFFDIIKNLKGKFALSWSDNALIRREFADYIIEPLKNYRCITSRYNKNRTITQDLLIKNY